MAENEYKDNEKVLHRAKCKLKLPHKEPEEAECFVTEGQVIIEAGATIKIPISRIKHVEEYSNIGFLQYVGRSVMSQGGLKGAVTLTFLDEQDKKQELSLEMAVIDSGYFKTELDNQLAGRR